MLLLVKSIQTLSKMLILDIYQETDPTPLATENRQQNMSQIKGSQSPPARNTARNAWRQKVTRSHGPERKASTGSSCLSPREAEATRHFRLQH